MVVSSEVITQLEGGNIVVPRKVITYLQTGNIFVPNENTTYYRMAIWGCQVKESHKSNV